MTYLPRWGRIGPGASPSGPTLAAFAWAGWPAASCPTPTDVAVYPHQVPATTIDDDDNHITAITAAKRGALAVTYIRADGLVVHALTAHLKSKLLTFPGHDPHHPRFDTRDEAERAHFGLYALHQRAAEAVTIRAWATDQLQGEGQERHVLVCGDLNDTLQAATTQVLLGRPGSQLGTGGFNQPDWGDGNRLWNLAPKMTKMTTRTKRVTGMLLVSIITCGHLSVAL